MFHLRGMLPSVKSIFLLLVLIYSGQAAAAEKAVRLGWQVPWATQGQLVTALKRTNIPELARVQIEFIGFSYGAPLNQAALSSQVDMLLTADQPAIVLMSRSDAFTVVARMMYNKVCIYVPPNSPVTSLAELRNKTIMGPVGAAAERVALEALQEVGIGPADFRSGDIGMAQQSALVQKSKESWGDADALYGFDPLPTMFEDKGLARMLHCGRVVAVVVASREMLNNRRRELVNFLTAFKLAWHYFGTHSDLVNGWYADEARLNVSSEILDRVASVEPNRSAKTIEDLRLELSQEDLSSMVATEVFLRNRGTTRKAVALPTRIDFGPLESTVIGRELHDLTRQIRPLCDYAAGLSVAGCR